MNKKTTKAQRAEGEMTKFIQGLELGRSFYFEAVKPILDGRFQDLRYSSGLIGSGSEILGFDTEMSSDHHWGPRVMLFLEEIDYNNYRDSINEELRNNLPTKFGGYSTNFSLPDPND